MNDINGIRKLFEDGMLSVAMLPEKNDCLLNDEGKKLRNELIKNKNVGSYHGMSPEEKVHYLDLAALDPFDWTVALIDHDYPAKTPKMWNTVYEKYGMKCRNVIVVASPDDRQKILYTFRQDNKYLGGGIGSGFKDKVMHLLDYSDQDAQRVGSVNLVVKLPVIEKETGKHCGFRLFGYNTDGIGFVAGIEAYGEEIAKKKVVVLGAGGAARPIVYELAKRGPAEIVILNRTIEKAYNIAGSIRKIMHASVRGAGEDAIGKEFRDADIVINVSNKGTEGELSPYTAFGTTAEENKIIENENKAVLKQGCESEKNLLNLRKSAMICDINIRERGTATLRVADSYGYNRLQDGLSMVVYQAIPAFRHVHGNIVPEDDLKRIMSAAAGLKN